METNLILDNLNDKIILLNEKFEIVYYNKTAKDSFSLLEKDNLVTNCFNADEKEKSRLIDSLKLVNKSIESDFIFNLENIYQYFEIKKIEKNQFLLKIFDFLKNPSFNFLNSINSGWIICKPDTLEVIYANKHFFEITKYEKDEIIGKNLTILKVDESDILQRDKLEEAIKNNEPTHVILKNRTKEGNTIYCKVNISPIFNKQTGRLQFYLAIQNDITDEYTKKLHYKNILNTSSSIILTTNGKELKTINKRFFDLFPFSDFDDFKSKHKCICDLFIKKLPHYIMPHMNQQTWVEYIKDNKPSFSNKLLNVHKCCMIDKDGNERVFQIDYAGKLFEEDNEEEIILNEITELIKTQTMLKEQTKMAAMGEMVAMIAHQWRQPLTVLASINTKLKVLREMEMLSDEKFNDSHKKSADIINYMSTTINDFRDFFSVDSNNKEEIQIKFLVNKATSLFKGLYSNKNIEFIENFQGNENIKIKIFTSKFLQVLINLIKNAIDAINDKNPDNKFIKINVTIDNEYINFYVEDSAGGIPTDIINKIFEPYFSTKDLNGTGLGLYMNKMIIEEHFKGSLNVENSENGALFTIRMPLNI